MAISFTCRVVAVPEALVSMIAGESVILNCKNEQYYGLDDVGTNMWTKLTSSPSIQSAYDALLAEYDVESDKLRTDLIELLEKLVAQGLIEIHEN